MKKAQNLIEYMLIAMLVAMVGYIFASHMDMNKIKTLIFNQPQKKDSQQLIIRSMTR